ncbi:MAG TPA: wax ester/triacylglycerol synthase family O-acyltransferase, partial [Mycobacteriales bacterium]|nr:wax ester/triacylglycerol synthase family O-acyltransferase [Mycobacteriales bacterium]
FDIAYHVRRSALPRPGSEDQLRELVGRVQSRSLDRDRPLWELYLVEGLAGSSETNVRFAIITKVHHAVAGDVGIDITSLLLDATPDAQPVPDDGWSPTPEPSPLELLTGAVADNLRRPTQVLDTLRSEVTDVKAAAGRTLGAAGGVLSAVRKSLRPAPASPLNVAVGEQRRFGMVATDLEDYRRVRKAHSGTVNDVVLATVAGALRIWLLTRGESVTGATTLRALVPVSVRDASNERTQAGDATPTGGLSALFVDLPVGEGSPIVRLHRVSYATKAHQESGQSISAEAIRSLSGFAPPTIHSAAARLGARMTRRLFNVVVSNVPGPQQPMYAGGARLIECYPVVPLGQDQALTIGLTSYNGGVFYGLNVDRDAMPDVDVLAQCIQESLAELVESVR